MYPQTQKCNIDGVNLRQVLYMGASFFTFAVFFQSGPGLGGSRGGEDGHRGIGVHVKETQKCSSNPKNPPNFFETPNPPTFLPHQPFYPPTFLPTNVCWMTVHNTQHNTTASECVKAVQKAACGSLHCGLHLHHLLFGPLLLILGPEKPSKPHIFTPEPIPRGTQAVSGCLEGLGGT